MCGNFYFFYGLVGGKRDAYFGRRQNQGRRKPGRRKACPYSIAPLLHFVFIIFLFFSSMIYERRQAPPLPLASFAPFLF